MMVVMIMVVAMAMAMAVVMRMVMIVFEQEYTGDVDGKTDNGNENCFVKMYGLGREQALDRFDEHQ